MIPKVFGIELRKEIVIKQQNLLTVWDESLGTII